MDNNIVETIYSTLDSSTDEIGQAIAERDALEQKINSGRYSPQALRDEIYPKRDELRQKVKILCNSALNEARNHVAKYRADAAELDNLDPAELTDDVKLLQSGITLKPRDIQGMLKRNEGNRTMLQIILRYAEEHKIDTGGTFYVGGQQEKQTADSLDQIIHYYEKWIDKPNSKQMLRKFFGIEDEE